MGVWQSLEVPGYGRLTVRDDAEVRSIDAPGEVFDDAIVLEFESNAALPPDSGAFPAIRRARITCARRER